jgi:pimeloyl-ACP methyl ester carboxylesterase
MITEQLVTERSIRGLKFVALRDGRRLSYTEYGAADGSPVLYCHGNPGSRLDLGLFDENVLKQYGLRMIAPDRPGIGQSDFLPARKIVDWPVDVTELADSLRIPQFSVFGFSCGGPFAAVSAYKFPERVTKLVLVSSIGRFDFPNTTKGMGPGLMYFRLGRYFPWLLHMELRMMGYGLKYDPSKMAEQVKMSLPPADLAAINQPGVLEAFLATQAEFLRQGPQGPALEAGLFMRPWGFPLEAIRVPTYLWHGQADRNAPVAMGSNLARRIPGCQAIFIPDEGHFSVAENHLAEILDCLAK